MSQLKKVKLPIYAVDMGKNNPLPVLWDVRESNRKFVPYEIKENDLCLSDKYNCSIFPYSERSGYNRELVYDSADAIVLENEYLIATFTPQWGGKLWSLFDKKENKELLFANHVFRPANLALRSAWASGGIEWNFSQTAGHSPYTCDKMFTNIISKEESGLGCPVLRMYNYERIRQVSYQMDFYLPDGSKFLHCRTRIVNEAPYETYAYWWSNVAVPTSNGARCIMPADTAFTTTGSISAISKDEIAVVEVPVPNYNDADITYALNTTRAKDYFFNTKNCKRKYITQVDENGYGLCEFSTSKLKGRKLFVWGLGKGCDRWQEFLSGDDGHGNYQDGRYCEIQCGLGRTQYEVVPMPKDECWEWVEYYGAIKIDPKDAHGDWQTAKQTVEKVLDKEFSIEDAEKELNDTRKMATTRLGEVYMRGEGFAELENIRRKQNGEKPLTEHLDFGTTDADQQMWISLVKDGTLKTDKTLDSSVAPLSYQRSEEWQRLLRSAINGKDKEFWLTYYMLGSALLAEKKLDESKEMLEKSVVLEKTAWNMFALSQYYKTVLDKEKCLEYILEAVKLNPTETELIKKATLAFADAEKWAELKTFIESLDEKVQKEPRVIVGYCNALIGLGEIEKAQDLLYKDGVALEVPDMKEGETTLSTAWIKIQEIKAQRKGEEFDAKAVSVPQQLNFRMNGQ